MAKKSKLTRTERALLSMTRGIAGVQKEISDVAKTLLPVAQLFEVFEKRLLEHETLLEKVRLTNEMAEQTLLNCLLAIRQNDALRAWFPAQRGHKEQKVAGPHPTWIEDRLKEKANAGTGTGDCDG